MIQNTINKTLPYLTCLQNTVVDLSAAAASNPGAVAQGEVAAGLLNYMVIQRSTAQTLQAESYIALLPQLSIAEAMLGPAHPAIGTLQELKSICTTSNVDAFDRCLQLMSDVQQALFALDTAESSKLCKAILQIEANYFGRFQAAVEALAAASANKGKVDTTARNARSYDEKKLLEFIRKTFPEESDVGIEKSGYISGGFSKFTIGITLSGVKALPKEIVLRGDASATFGGASVVEEYNLVKALYDNGACVAKPLALEASGKVFGSPFLLAERRPGIIIGHTFNLPKPNKAICIDVATRLAAAHRVPLAALGTRIGNANGKSSDKALAWIDEGLNNWQPLNMPSSVFKTAFEWLRRNAGINDKVPRALVHGDYSLSNVLLHEDRVSAILDWEFAHVGNPAYDLGYFHYQAKALDSWETFLDAYGKAGMPIPSEEQLNYNLLLADTRLGVMVCQVKNVFTSGAEAGSATASIMVKLQYEQTIARITDTLNKVL